MDRQLLAGKVAVVTGAASGIGAAVVERFLAEGAHVIAVDLTEPDGAAPAGVLPLAGDVAQAGTWTRIADLARAEFGRLDVLHSNASVNITAPAHELAETDWNRQIAVNLTATYLGVRACVGLLGAGFPERGAGAVVLSSSVHAVAGLPGHPAYAAAKGGLISLGRQLAVEYGPRVRVNTVLPGPILTPAWDGVSAEDRRRSAAATAAGRFGRPEEVAAAVVFLASAQSSYITGTSLLVDGGWSAKKDSA
ncbi:SDR family oxidoreductase [Nonomuraea terrae]|uniref:SDR family oxidoreductase n=2 Tax=Nonomuraea terrae TaxID=2530383 RepID=A0A4R4YED9_9ACTN|nr:SDR family oxidoreductase [Nonomuraea terrae]